MSRSKYCRKCDEPVVLDRETNTFVCPHGCDTDPSTEVDEAEYTYGGVEIDR